VEVVARMKTLHLYLTRQVLATLLMTVTVFTFVLLLGNMLNEIVGLLVRRQASLFGVLEAFGLLIPFVLVFALPMGMLTAALLVFGRFSADQELTAVRSSGISLAALVIPILILSLVLCGFSAWINMEVGPRCRIAYKHLLYEMVGKLGGAVIPEGRYVKDYPPYMYYVGHNDGGELHDIRACRFDMNGELDEVLTADRGRVYVTNEELHVLLFDAHLLSREDSGMFSSGEQSEWKMMFRLDQNNQSESQAISDMTIGQLQAQLRDLEHSFSVPETNKLNGAQLRLQKEQLEKQKTDITMPVLVQIHREVATSFACFGFTLIGIPLGIRAHRRETNIGIVMALALVLFYYSFIILGQSLRTHAELAPHLIVWVPNFIFQTVGAVMLWKANRGI
jgi:lipopolysaccharide export LptBFGC system permease protein LptF